MDVGKRSANTEDVGASRTIAELLFAKRTELDLNQADMARTLGVSQANYSRWETSQSVPAPESWEALSTFFKIDESEMGRALLATGRAIAERKRLHRR